MTTIGHCPTVGQSEYAALYGAVSEFNRLLDEWIADGQPPAELDDPERRQATYISWSVMLVKARALRDTGSDWPEHRRLASTVLDDIRLTRPRPLYIVR